MSNADTPTVRGFGEEWAHFDQASLSADERRRQFDQYFSVFPWDQLPPNAVGFDMGCGSGRWALEVADRVGRLVCLDGSGAALEVAKANLKTKTNCDFYEATFGNLPLEDASMDMGYCLGVLHHVPDTGAALDECVRKLKAGAPFLVYLYYDFENRPAWFRLIWRACNGPRRLISRLPFRSRVAVTTVIAATVYWPLARASAVGEHIGLPFSNIPLSSYRDRSFYSMRTDALDRFGTRLEKRFSRASVVELMEASGLCRVQVSDGVPYWCAVGWRAPTDT